MYYTINLFLPQSAPYYCHWFWLRRLDCGWHRGRQFSIVPIVLGLRCAGE